MLLAADLPGVARAASDDPDIRANGEDGAVEGRHAPRPRSSPSPYVFGGIIAVVLVVVLAMPRPVAERIGWPRRQPTWSQAYGLALQGWKAAGKPELGEFRMGTSDPFVSTAGLATLVASGYAAAELVHHTPTPLSLTVL